MEVIKSAILPCKEKYLKIKDTISLHITGLSDITDSHWDTNNYP